MSTVQRFLQQETIRLKQEKELLKHENQQLRHYLDLIQTFYQAAQIISQDDNPMPRLDKLLDQILALTEATDGSLSLLDQDTGELVFSIVHGAVRDQLEGYRMSSTEGVAGWVVENQEVVIVNNTRQDWRFSDMVDRAFGFYSRSILGVPIIKEDQVIGLVELVNKRDHNFTQADATLLIGYANVVIAALARLIIPAKPLSV